MEENIKNLTKSFIKKGYEVYSNGKSEDLIKLFNKGQPLGTLLEMLSGRLENLKKLQDLGEDHHNNKSIKEEKKELEAIKNNFESLHNVLSNNKNPRGAINEFVDRNNKDDSFLEKKGSRSFGDLIKSLIYTIFPSKYESDKKKVLEGITEDVNKLMESQNALSKEVMNKEKEFLDNSVQKVKDMIIERRNSLLGLKDSIADVLIERPKGELLPDGSAFHPSSLKLDYEKNANDNIPLMKGIRDINHEMGYLFEQEYCLIELERRLGKDNKPKAELFNKTVNELDELAKKYTDNGFTQEVKKLAENISESKNLNIVDSIKILKESNQELAQKTEGFKENSKAIINVIQITDKQEKKPLKEKNIKEHNKINFVDKLLSSISPDIFKEQSHQSKVKQSRIKKDDNLPTQGPKTTIGR